MVGLAKLAYIKSPHLKKRRLPSAISTFDSRQRRKNEKKKYDRYYS
jgi:hypothetical protein